MPGSRIRIAASRLSREERGLTLIELLVVLIIIGILAAIAIAAFANQQNKAHDADAKVHARSAETAMETYYLEHKSYAGATKTELEQEQSSLKDAYNLSVTIATSNEYEVASASSSTASVTYRIHRTPTGTIQRTCAPVNTGGCKASGTW